MADQQGRIVPSLLGRGQSLSNYTPLPVIGFVRLSSIIGPKGPIPVATWWEGVKSGRFPKPVKLGPRITAGRFADIRALIERGAG